MKRGDSVEFLRRQIKIAFYEGEHIYCDICKKRIYSMDSRNKKGLTIDHTVPKSWGGTDHISNLQPAHKDCNQKKGNKVWTKKKTKLLHKFKY